MHCLINLFKSLHINSFIHLSIYRSIYSLIFRIIHSSTHPLIYLSTYFSSSEYLDKWISEPMKAIIIWTRIFSINKTQKKLSLPKKVKEILLALCDKFQVRIKLKNRVI